MPSRFDMPEGPKQPGAELPQIDISRRYDVYCCERNQQIVVYRNARFKGRSRLLGRGKYDLSPEFLELEQSNGQMVFLMTYSVVKFCEPGAELGGESVPAK